MDMNFRWMTQPYEDAAREAENRERKEAIARQLGMRNAAQGAFDAGQQAFGAMQRQNDAVANALSPQGQQQFQMGMQNQMAQQAQQAADLKRLAELEAKRNARMNDPNMRMAAMLAMAGQPGALMGMMTAPRQDNRSQSQAEMDTLEEKIANDMFALAGADEDTYSKLTSAILPLYKSKFDELSGKGAKSRMGSDWDSGWGRIFSGETGKRGDRKRKADINKANAKKAADLLRGR